MAEVETATMSERGQIIIPKDIRKYIGAVENTIFTVMPIDKQTIIMKKLDTRKLLQEFRDLRARVKEKMSSQEISQEIASLRKRKRR